MLVRVFMPSGSPEGLLVVDVSNWSGTGILFPRTLFTEVRGRKEAQCPGVYMLWSPDKPDDQPRVYIGEGDPVLPRLDDHMRNRDDWTRGVFFSDRSLNKAHIQYLESRLVNAAKTARRCTLHNLQTPDLPTVSEQDRSHAERFLGNVLTCLPVLGIRFLEPAVVGPVERLQWHLEGKGVQARGYESPDGFVVMEGSTAVTTAVEKAPDRSKELRSRLLQQGKLKAANGWLVFKEDVTFTSSSAAADVILGVSTSGPAAWKDADGRTLKEIRQEQTRAVANNS